MLQIEGYSYPLVAYAGPFILWILFFVMGIWFSTHSRDNILRPGIFIAIIGLAASIVECKYYLPLHGGGLGIKFSAFIYSIGAIMILFASQLEKSFTINRFTRLVLWIGEISFGLYLLHMYVRIAISFILPNNNWIISWALTMLISCILILIATKAVPGKTLSKYFGIR